MTYQYVSKRDKEDLDEILNALAKDVKEEEKKEEGKKEFAARQKTEREEKLHALLSDSELTELQSYLDHDKAAQLAWEERVKNGISA